MKTFIPLACVACILASVAPSCVTAQTANVSVSGPATVSQGSSFAVDIDILGVNDLYAFQLDLDFNSGVLSATGVTEGGFLPAGGSTFFVPGTIDDVAGSITNNADTLLTAISGVTGNGTLIVFDFNALTPGTSTLDLANVTLLDSGLNNIAFTSANGEIIVTGGAIPTPEPNTLILLTAGLLSLGVSTKFRRVRQQGPRCSTRVQI